MTNGHADCSSSSGPSTVAASSTQRVDDVSVLLATAAVRVFGGARNLTLGDIAVAAYAMATAMDGSVLDFSVQRGDGPSLYSCTLGFERNGERYRVTVGFVFASDGTVIMLLRLIVLPRGGVLSRAVFGVRMVYCAWCSRMQCGARGGGSRACACA